MYIKQEDFNYIYVVDTSVLIEDPKVFFRLGRSQIFIPMAVMKELDGLKKSTNLARAGAARRVTRILDGLSGSQDIAHGASTSSGSIVRIFSRYMTIDGLASDADNKIVGAALRLKLETGNANVIVLTTDGNMRNVARSYGMKAQNYPLTPNHFVDNPVTKPYSRTKPSLDTKAA
jgi:predicted ribonuclease YlaK